MYVSADCVACKWRYPPFITLILKFKDIEVGINRKPVCDFLLVLIEQLSLGVTAAALRANISSKSAILLQLGPVDPKFQVEGSPPPTIFLLRKLG